MLCPKNELERCCSVLRCLSRRWRPTTRNCFMMTRTYHHSYHRFRVCPSPAGRLNQPSCNCHFARQSCLGCHRPLLGVLLHAHIRQTLQKCWCEGPCTLPTDWYRSAICLLPKPGKSPSNPKALRPICLQHPICKVLDRLAVEKAQQERPDLFRHLPCFAYLKAILQKASHTGIPSKSSLRGSLQLCVDLSQAFDRVPRQLVEESVKAAGYSPAIEAALLIWLHGGIFQLNHKGMRADVPCTRGVKQGSRGGPLQWRLVTRYIFLQLAQTKGVEWLQQHVLNFADDFHGAWIGHSEISMHQAARDIADLLEALEFVGLTLNLAKSAAILKVVGPKARAFYKNYVMRRSHGIYLKCITRSGRVYHVPLVKKWDYLRATLSYTHHAADTVQRRLKAADHAFSKLRHVLGAHRGLPVKQCLVVYDACVQSTLLYAVLAVGMGTTEAKQIHYLTMKHLRFIARPPRHMTHRTNEDLCRRLNRPLPLEHLRNTWEKKSRAWLDRRQNLDPQDIIHLVPQYPDLLSGLVL